VSPLRGSSHEIIAAWIRPWVGTHGCDDGSPTGFGADEGLGPCVRVIPPTDLGDDVREADLKIHPPQGCYGERVDEHSIVD
jgi:hypothetical protein